MLPLGRVIAALTDGVGRAPVLRSDRTDDASSIEEVAAGVPSIPLGETSTNRTRAGEPLGGGDGS
jgi:hypothetical protein